MMEKMMMTNGEKVGGLQASPLRSLFLQQAAFQKEVTGEVTPVDDVSWFAYHVTAMQEELGEVLKADKRWKTHRNAFYDKENKLEEIADVFVTAINIALFSGFDHRDIYEAIVTKISENTDKLGKAKGATDDSNR